MCTLLWCILWLTETDCFLFTRLADCACLFSRLVFVSIEPLPHWTVYVYIYGTYIHTEAMARDDLYYCFFFVLLAKGMTSYGPTTTVVKAINVPSGPSIVWNLCPVKTHNNSSLSLFHRPTPNPLSQLPHPLLRQRPSSMFSHRFSTSRHTPQP